MYSNNSYKRERTSWNRSQIIAFLNKECKFNDRISSILIFVDIVDDIAHLKLL